MNFSVKQGVRVFGRRPEMNIVDLVVTGVCAEMGVAAVLTAAIEGKHSRESFHYAGCASDYRTRDIPEDRRVEFRDKVRARLPEDYDVVLETSPPHLHVEFQPKTPYTGG